MPKPIEHLNARASDGDHRRQQCDGKVRFNTRADAQTMVKKQQRRHSGGQRRLSAYPCRHCGGFHTGQSVAPRKVRERFNRGAPLIEDDECLLDGGTKP